MDGYAALHRAVREMKAAGALPEAVKLRSSQYLNNTIARDHRGVKARTGPMPGFKRFKTAAITLAGIELMRRIYKRQFDFSRLRFQGTTAPEIWNTVLAE
jgi:transposase-like protein